jgi:hypothetical protein
LLLSLKEPCGGDATDNLSADLMARRTSTLNVLDRNLQRDIEETRRCGKRIARSLLMASCSRQSAVTTGGRSVPDIRHSVYAMFDLRTCTILFFDNARTDSSRVHVEADVFRG